MKKFYLASPFFNEEQINVCKAIEDKAGSLPESLSCFSPRLEALCPPGAPIEQRRKSFDLNCSGINQSDFVLARIDDYDPGTIWELGFGYGLRFSHRDLPDVRPQIYCFTTVEQGRGLNLMLAQGSAGFLRGIPQVLQFLNEVAERGDFSLAESWKKEIQ